MVLRETGWQVGSEQDLNGRVMGRHGGRRAPHTLGSMRESRSREGEALESANGQGGSSEVGKRKKNSGRSWLKRKI